MYSNGFSSFLGVLQLPRTPAGAAHVSCDTGAAMIRVVLRVYFSLSLARELRRCCRKLTLRLLGHGADTG